MRNIDRLNTNIKESMQIMVIQSNYECCSYHIEGLDL